MSELRSCTKNDGIEEEYNEFDSILDEESGEMDPVAEYLPPRVNEKFPTEVVDRVVKFSILTFP